MRTTIGRAAVLAGACVGVGLAARSAAAYRRWYALSGRTALITGGSRGLGLVLARRLVRRGCRVAVCARDAGELERARRELEQLGGEVQPVLCDVTEREEVRRMVRDVEAGTGPVDILVNNAGTITVGPAETMTVHEYKEAMKVHFWGPLYTTLEVAPGMRRRGSGRIVNIASIGGKVPVPHLAPYCASKFALVGFSESLRAELARDGVYVTTVCPGLMRTGSHLHAEFKGRYREEFAWFTWSEAVPGASVSAERAARRIVRAIELGEAEVVIGIPAVVAAKVHALAPEWSSDVLALVNRLLPTSGGIGRAKAKGWESGSAASRTAEAMGGLQEAAARNNETGR